MLSPFEVTTDQDTGFVAAGSLAGGRLAGELRDTPVAYSVMTREFIDALGIVDLLEATSWSTGNTERLTPGGQDFFANTGEYSTRGFISTGGTNAGALRQRNFFPMFTYGDSYNLERYDFGRGPNSILFGNGSLGGVSSSTT
ncbi:MAG: TonB-dependent receptor plug domain-containing protein, partial [Opitutaceae bacterium]